MFRRGAVSIISDSAFANVERVGMRKPSPSSIVLANGGRRFIFWFIDYLFINVMLAKRRHVGKWIGVKGTDVLVVSDSHDKALGELRKKGVDGAYVFYSPTETDKQYGFLFLVSIWKLSNENSSLV